MLTQNYYNLIKGVIKGIDPQVRLIDGTYKIITIIGDSSSMPYLLRALSPRYSLSKASGPTSLGSVTRIALGTSDTEPSETDYKLAGTDMTTITASVATDTDGSTDAISTVRKTVTVTNTSNASITIKEVALYAAYYDGDKHCNFMLDRTVLTEPVTIPAGAVGQVVYNITIIE